MAKHKKGVGSRWKRGVAKECPSCGRKIHWVEVGSKLIIADQMRDGSYKTHQCGRRL